MDVQHELDTLQRRTVEDIIRLIRDTVHTHSGYITKSALIGEIERHYCIRDKACVRCGERRDYSYYAYRTDRTRTAVCVACYKMRVETWKDHNQARIMGYKKKYKEKHHGEQRLPPPAHPPTILGV